MQRGKAATERREAFGVRPGLPALSTTRRARKREQAPRTPNASRLIAQPENPRSLRTIWPIAMQSGKPQPNEGNHEWTPIDTNPKERKLIPAGGTDFTKGNEG